MHPTKTAKADMRRWACVSSPSHWAVSFEPGLTVALPALELTVEQAGLKFTEIHLPSECSATTPSRNHSEGSTSKRDADADADTAVNRERDSVSHALLLLGENNNDKQKQNVNKATLDSVIV